MKRWIGLSIKAFTNIELNIRQTPRCSLLM